MTTFPEAMWKVIACPSCGGILVRQDDKLRCDECNCEYAFRDDAQIDLRLQKQKTYTLDFDVPPSLAPLFQVGHNYQSEKDAIFKTLSNTHPAEVDYSNITPPTRLTNKLLRYFPKASGKADMVLDLGCGTTIHREVCERAGFTYLGLDIDSDEAQILGDALALPFLDNSFEFVLCIGVIQHTNNPFVMSTEMYRVLKPGGRVIGSVPFLEPFTDSYYPHTHIGTYNSLHYAGFLVEHVAPVDHWPVLTAQGQMILFPGMPAFLTKLTVLPLHALHRMWYAVARLVTKTKKASEGYRKLATAGSFHFIAKKPAD